MIPSDSEIRKILQVLYNSTFMPMHLYREEKYICSFPANALPMEFITTCRNQLTSSAEDLYYISTREFLHVGIVRDLSRKQDVIIGPITSMSLTENDIHSIISDCALPVEYKDAIQNFYNQTPHFSLSRFLNILVLVNMELNHTIIDVFEKFGFIDNSTEKNVGAHHSSALVERKEHAFFHNTYYFEQQYYNFVEKGDVDGLLHFLQSTPSYTEGRTSNDSIRQAKNMFISSTALTTRHAIAGGLDIETAYQLSDSYIQEVERMTNPASITALNATCTVDFTKRVSAAKIPSGMSRDIFAAIQYISNHVNRNISVEAVARQLNMDRTSLSKKFKRELGFNIGSYIMRRKLEEAKSLLTYTDKTVSEISEYLCFSSQSYFQNVFKAKYGMTPKEYRKSQK